MARRTLPASVFCLTLVLGRLGESDAAADGDPALELAGVARGGVRRPVDALDLSGHVRLKQVGGRYRGTVSAEEWAATPPERLQAGRGWFPHANGWRRSRRARRLEAAITNRDLPAALCVALLDGEDIDLSDVACQDQRLIAELLLNLNRASRQVLLRELGGDELVMLNRLDIAIVNAKAEKLTKRDADQAGTGRLRRSTDTARIVAELTRQTRTASRPASGYRRRFGDQSEPYDA